MAADDAPSGGAADVALTGAERWQEPFHLTGLATLVDASNRFHFVFGRNSAEESGKIFVIPDIFWGLFATADSRYT